MRTNRTIKVEQRRGDWRYAAVLLLSGWVLAPGPLLRAQAPRAQQVTEPGSIAGKVVTGSGAAVDGATIEVRAEGAKNVAEIVLVSDAAGKFRGRVTTAGAYTVLARAQDGQSGSATVQVQRGEERVVQLVVSGTKNEGAAVEFSDKPNFAVAGVTDWTAVGGHGSDATLRTSEDLARETLRLKAADATPGRVLGEGSGGASESERTLRAAVAAAPKSYQANRELGLYYLRAGQFRAAEPWLTAASALSGGEAEFELAQACLGLGDLPRAREHVERALAKRDLGEYHRVAGEIAERLGDPLAAVRQEAIATRLSPSEENYFVWGSELLLHRAIWQAAEVFEHGVAAHPDSARMKTGWGAALFGEALYRKAAEALCAASDQSPSDTETYNFLGKVALASPEPLPCVQEKLRRQLALQPGKAEANYFAAMYAIRHGGSATNTAEVTRLLQRATALDPKFADAYLQLGILAFQRKRYGEAIEFYRQAITADATLPEPHYRLGVAYDRIGEPTKAKQEFETHARCEQTRAEATEQQRREVKQFLVVLGDKGGSAGGGL